MSKKKPGAKRESQRTPAGKSVATPRLSPDPRDLAGLVTLADAGRYTEAAILARAMTINFPLHGPGWTALGWLLRAMQRIEDSLPALKQAVALSPGDPAALKLLGDTFADLGRPEAEVCYREALRLRPDFAEGLNCLGNLLLGLGRPDEAASSYRRALQIAPKFAEAHNNLGNALSELGRFQEAADCYESALQIRPDYAEAHNNLGNVLPNLDMFGEAEISYRRALAIKPDFAEAHSNLGNFLQNLGKLEDAAACYRQALAIRPDFAKAHNNLGNALKDLGRLDEAMASHRQALRIKPDYVEAQSNLLGSLVYYGATTAEYRAEACRFDMMVTGKAGTSFVSWHCPDRPTRLRVGLVSGDFRQHAVSYFLEGILASIDPGRIELFAYPTHHDADELTARIKPCFVAWTPLFGLGDEAAARLIHDDGVHILIDLSGHSAHNRLPVFAWKPAPVQVTWLGYLASTGMKAIDYLLADPWTLPVSAEAHFVETIWRLPESYICFTPPDGDAPVSSLPALATGVITFGSFNNLTKISDAVVALWARVLVAVPDSRLLLKATQLSASAVLRDTMDRFAVHAIDATRLILEGPVKDRAEHLAAYRRLDIALDPFPYPGITTSAESLWMGVPVLTLTGEDFLSRQGVGLLMNADLPEWIAADADDYVRRAATHAADLDRLAALRSRLRQKVLASAAFDAPRFARHFEDALRAMWERYRAQRDAAQQIA